MLHVMAGVGLLCSSPLRERRDSLTQSRPSPLLVSVGVGARSFLALLLTSQEVVRGPFHHVHDAIVA